MKKFILVLTMLALGTSLCWPGQAAIYSGTSASGKYDFQAQTIRPVVIEKFTATWCGPCYSASMALDRIKQETSRSEIIIISYHWADAFSTSFCDFRREEMEVSGVPTVFFNAVGESIGGWTISFGESGISSHKAIFESAIQQEQTRMGDHMPFQCELFGEMTSSDLEWTLRVTSNTGHPNPVTAYMIVTESDIAVDASNGLTVLNTVCRGSLGSEVFTMSEPGQREIQGSHTGVIPHVSVSNLEPVAFLVDNETGEVVGGVGMFSELSPATFCNTWHLYE